LKLEFWPRSTFWRCAIFANVFQLSQSIEHSLGAANRCNISFFLIPGMTGFTVLVEGNPSSIAILAESIFSLVSNFVLSEKKYQLALQEKLDTCKRAKDAGSSSMCAVNSMLFTSYPILSSEREAELLGDLTFKKTSRFSLSELNFRARIVCFASGDLSREDAYRLGELAEAKLRPLEFRPAVLPRVRTVKLPRGTTRVSGTYHGHNETVNALDIVFQIPKKHLYQQLAILYVFKALGEQIMS
jgi:secreted Zn-dependent insulinase-like peptidase